MKLPQSYRTAMQELLGEQAQAYFESFDQPAYQSIRINTNKIPLYIKTDSLDQQWLLYLARRSSW